MLSSSEEEEEGRSNSEGEESEEDEIIEIPKGVDIRDKKVMKGILDKLQRKRRRGSNFSVNYDLVPDLVPFFWASVHQYFQEVMEAFITSDGWRLIDFIKVAEGKKLHQLYRCAYTTRGTIERQGKHFQLVFDILLDASKFQWLCPWKMRNTFGLSVCIKRQVGGLYLSYFLLMKQPEPPQGMRANEKQKMKIDANDSRAIRFFINDLDKLEDSGGGSDLKKEAKLAFLKLHHLGLFQKTMLRDNYGLDSPTLMLMGYKTNPRLNYFGLIKDVRDKLLYLTYQGIGNTTFKQMLKVANILLDKDSRKTGTRRERGNSPRKEDPSSATEGETNDPSAFQARLRQRLDLQFQALHDKFRAPWLEEVEAEIECQDQFIYQQTSHSVEGDGGLKNDMASKMKCGLDDRSFPPPRKEHWTVDDVQSLKAERDLAVIAFRIVEILRFVTPANPLTTSRLVHENISSVNQNAKDMLAKYVEADRQRHEQVLVTPSCLDQSTGTRRTKKTAETRSWMEYLKGKKKTKHLTAQEMLEKLRTHDVVATEPTLIFQPRDKPDDSVPIVGDEEFAFEFSRNNDRLSESEEEIDLGERGDNGIALTNSPFCHMPDLDKFSGPEGQAYPHPPQQYSHEVPPLMAEGRSVSLSLPLNNADSISTAKDAATEPSRPKSFLILAEELFQTRMTQTEKTRSPSVSNKAHPSSGPETGANDKDRQTEAAAEQMPEKPSIGTRRKQKLQTSPHKAKECPTPATEHSTRDLRSNQKSPGKTALPQSQSQSVSPPVQKRRTSPRRGKRKHS